MSFSVSKTVVGQRLPYTRVDGSHSLMKGSTTVVMVKKKDLPLATTQLNVKKEKIQQQETLTAVSRREIMSLAGISLASISLLLGGPAEARMSRAAIKNKLLEKLRELREKVGLPKQEDKSGEKATSPQTDNEVEETKPMPRPESEGGEDKSSEPQQRDSVEESSPKLESAGGDNFTPELENGSGEKSTAQLENTSEEKSTPIIPDDEGGDKARIQEDEGGKKSKLSTPQKVGSPFLPFLNLSEGEAEPLVEATLSQ